MSYCMCSLFKTENDALVSDCRDTAQPNDCCQLNRFAWHILAIAQIILATYVVYVILLLIFE